MKNNILDMKFTKTLKKITIMLMIMGTTTGTVAAAAPVSVNPVKVEAVTHHHRRIKYSRVTVTIVNQYNMDPEDMVKATKHAIYEWDRWSRANLVFTPHNPHANITIYIDHLGKGILGATTPRKLDHVNIFIDPDNTADADDWLDNNIEHELGHAMGLGHSREHYSIMYPTDTYDDVAYITDKDTAHVNRAYVRNWGK